MSVARSEDDRAGGGRPAIFYGWWIVLLGALAQGVAGGQAYMTGLVIVSLQDKLVASTQGFLLATVGIQMAAYGVMAPLYARWIRRYSLRSVIALAFALAALGYVGIAFVAEIWQLALVYGLLFSLAYFGYVAGQTIVAQWFVAKRGMALGIAACGNVIPGFLVLPLLTYVTHRYGLAVACFGYAVFLTLLIPVALRFIVDWPEQKGLRPDGGDLPAAVADQKAPQPTEVWSFKRMLASPRFYVVALIVTILQATIIQLVTNLMPIFKSAGLGLGEAAMFVSILSVAALAGKLGMGWISDRVGTPLTVLLPVGFLAAGCFLLIGEANASRFLAASIFAGIGGGMVNVTFGVVIGRAFDRSLFSAIAAGTVPFFVLLMGLSMWGVGFSVDLTRSYDVALTGLACLLAVPAVLTFLLTPGPGTAARTRARSS